MPSRASEIGHGLARPVEPTSRCLGELLLRCAGPLRRWTHGRLPRWARTAADTSDLVQDALLRTLRRFDAFDSHGRQALAAYLRKAVLNRIHDEHRRVARWGIAVVPSETLAAARPSPYDSACAAEAEQRYRAGLSRLSPRDQELIVAHVELDYTHRQLGCMIGRSPNAARMALRRAITRLADEMRER